MVQLLEVMGVLAVGAAEAALPVELVLRAKETTAATGLALCLGAAAGRPA